MRQRSDPKSLDLATPCPLCGYRIPPSELLRTGFEQIRCPRCHGTFDPTAGKKPHTTS